MQSSWSSVFWMFYGVKKCKIVHKIETHCMPSRVFEIPTGFTANKRGGGTRQKWPTMFASPNLLNIWTIPLLIAITFGRRLLLICFPRKCKNYLDVGQVVRSGGWKRIGRYYLLLWQLLSDVCFRLRVVTGRARWLSRAAISYHYNASCILIVIFSHGPGAKQLSGLPQR
jgi:hypothetical protein